MILKNMNNLKTTNMNGHIIGETKILKRKHSKLIYKSPTLHKLGSLVKSTAGGGGSDVDAFTPAPFVPPN